MRPTGIDGLSRVRASQRRICFRGITRRAVNRCYRPEPFPSDRHRVEYRFTLYAQLTAPLVAAVRSDRKRQRARTPA